MKYKILAALALVSGLAACGDDTDVVENNTVIISNDTTPDVNNTTEDVNAIDRNEAKNNLR